MEGQKKLIWGMIIFIVVLLILAVLAATGFLKIPSKKIKEQKEQKKERVIQENLTIPDTKSVSGNEGRLVASSSVDTPLVPKSDEERVVVLNAVLTVKGVYDLTVGEAEKSADDIKLSFIKSFGAVMLDGKSSQWQAVFSSESKNKTYEFIVHENKIVSSREFTPEVISADLPSNWYDSDGAIKSIQTLPQFADATISSISFYYNIDSKSWEYALATSRGTTSMPVR